MNQVIETIFKHRSVRKFKDQKLTDEQIDQIVQAATMASTSSYMMAYTIIGVTDEAIKEQLAEISGQSYVKDNGHFLLFCADLNRLAITASPEEYEQMLPNLMNTEHFIVATVDAALAAQNAAIAAESMELGICYIGSIRNNINKVNQLFDLPTHVIPLFGLAIGVPKYLSNQKPRLPISSVYSENSYPSKDQLIASLEKFDAGVKDYYKERPTNSRLDSWTEQMIRNLSTPKRMDVTDFVKSKKYNLH